MEKRKFALGYIYFPKQAGFAPISARFFASTSQKRPFALHFHPNVPKTAILPRYRRRDPRAKTAQETIKQTSIRPFPGGLFFA
jgi:hypothetical protein